MSSLVITAAISIAIIAKHLLFNETGTPSETVIKIERKPTYTTVCRNKIREAVTTVLEIMLTIALVTILAGEFSK